MAIVMLVVLFAASKNLQVFYIILIVFLKMLLGWYKVKVLKP